jgi:alkanesulfonate monooxygenase SsuD/methylene tetrahydromethanopterin reductase-like flavin-dependent oxidoreductase (luciferase family)
MKRRWQVRKRKQRLVFHSQSTLHDYDLQAFVDATVCAQEMGFSTVWFGNHIFPWYHSSKKSCFVWSTMAAALEKTKRQYLSHLQEVKGAGKGN